MNKPIVWILTSMHAWDDHRIFHKQAKSLTSHFDVHLIAFGSSNNLPCIPNITIHLICPIRSKLLRIIVGTPILLFNLPLKKGGILITHDPSFLVWHWLPKFFGYRVVHDYHEDYQNQIHSKTYIPRFFRPSLAKIMRFSIAFSSFFTSKNICATETISKSVYSSQWCRTPIQTICNHSVFSKTHFQPRISTNNKLHCIYVGGLSRHRGLLTMSNATKQAGIELVLAGPWQIKDISPSDFQSCYPHVRYLGVLPHEEIQPLLKQADLGLCLLHPTPAYLESMPVKILEYVAAGIPFLASRFPTWEHFFTPLGVPNDWFVDPLNINDVIKAITEFKSKSSDDIRLSIRLREQLSKDFSWEQEAKNLLAFLIDSK